MKIVMLDSLTLGAFDKKIFEAFGEFISYPVTKSNEVIARAKDADIIITNKVVIDSKIMESLPNLKLICIAATGMNNIDLESAKNRNILVKNVAGYSTFAVAQHTLMMALSFLGALRYYTHYVSSGQWVKSEIFCHLDYELHDLYGKKWGIIGYGSIGKRVCSLAQAFGAQVVYHSLSGAKRDENIAQLGLDELLASCDIISIHAPLSSKSYNLISKKNIATLKKGAILLNLGRGGIVNESDIAEAILGGQDIYFGSDVLESEPMSADNALLKFFLESKKDFAKNSSIDSKRNSKVDSTQDSRDFKADSKVSLKHRILITPHIAWAYNNAKSTLLKGIAHNIQTFLSK